MRISSSTHAMRGLEAHPLRILRQRGEGVNVDPGGHVERIGFRLSQLQLALNND